MATIQQLKDAVESRGQMIAELTERIDWLQSALHTTTQPKNPLDIQIGGDSYKHLQIQPIEYIQANQLSYEEGNVVKYITRWKNKNGVQDLEKAKHYIDLLIAAQPAPKILEKCNQETAEEYSGGGDSGSRYPGITQKTL